MSETDFELLAARCGEMSVLVVISWIIVIKIVFLLKLLCKYLFSTFVV